MPKIAGCPFCGADEESDHKADCWFKLRRSGAMMSELAQAWNRRVATSPPVANDRPTWKDVQARERDIRALQSRIIELEAAPSSPVADVGLPNLDVILSGIDKDENESDDGWWPTSTGAEFGRKKLEEVRQAMREAYEAGRAAGVPDGWKLVPAEPTEAMEIAGGRDNIACGTCGYGNGGGDPARTYREMLAAAPQPPKAAP